MPIRRFRRRTRRPLRRRTTRSRRRFTRRTRVPRTLTSRRIHNMKCTIEFAGITGGSSDIFIGYTFKLADLPQVSSYQALFDQYRIMGIKWWALPQFTAHELSDLTSSNDVVPELYTAIDRNDNSSLNRTQIMQYDTLKSTIATKRHSRYFKPNILAPAYDNGSSVACITKFGQWISTSDVNVLHYGLKALLGTFTASGRTFQQVVYATYYVQFRSVK